MMAQGAVLFPDPKHIRLNTPAWRSCRDLLPGINVQHLGTLNMDTPAAIAAFVNGEGGIYPTGTWMIGSFQHEAEHRVGRSTRAMRCSPIPACGATLEFVSGHPGSSPRESARRSSAKRSRASSSSWRHDYDWARTGHIPAFKAVLDDPRFKALPHRSDIAPLASMGRPLPGYVLRQNAIEGIVGEEAAAAFTGQKTVPQALSEAERRVDVLLAQVRLDNLH